ncbi:MAG: hypothetical protein GY771_13830 [bacterium]|nr:hypothetical protein [bacterium]
MKTIFLIPVFFAASALAYESPIAVEGDGLELVREYRIEGDQYELVYEDEELAEGTLDDTNDRTLFPFRDIERVWQEDKMVKKRPHKVLVFDSTLSINKLTVDSDTWISNFRAFGNTGLYGYKKHPVGDYWGSLSWYWVYDIEDGFLFKVEGDNVEIIYEDNGSSIITGPEYAIRGTRMDIFDTNGESIIGLDIPSDTTVPYFNGSITAYVKDKPWFLVRNFFDPQEKYETDVDVGTVILDYLGNEKFRLNPDITALRWYGSGSYICQLGREYKPGSRKKYGNYILEVYDGSGGLLWDKEIATKIADFDFLVSDNEEYLCLITNFKKSTPSIFSNRAGISAYELATGKLVYDNDNIQMNERRLLVISNDGRTVLLHSDYDEFGNGGIYILKDGGVSAIIHPSKRPHRIDAQITPDGNYLIVGVPSSAKVFRIKK